MPDGLNLGNIPLGEHDADWMRVMAAASNSSLRVKVASICGYFVRRRKGEYIEIVNYIAAKYGLSFDEAFHKLKNGEDLGTPLDYFPLDHTMESKIDSDI